ncbi:MAG: OmpA family protein [Paludibacteraceae bacterium]|nr:OmpA family protein [Paludibacteraceae bacterium]
MCCKRIIVAMLALGAAIGIRAQEVLAGHELTEVRHSERRITLPGDVSSTDSLVEVHMLDVNTYVDTMRTVRQTERQFTQAPDSMCRRGHYVQIHAGAGYGNVGYGLLRKDLTHPTATGYETGGISAAVQLQYAYFFVPYVGIGIGLWLSEYTSHGYLQGDFVYPGQWDSDVDPSGVSKTSEQYTHHTTVRNWHERQTVHTAGLPVSLQFQAWGRRNKAGFFLALGAAPTYTVMTGYRVMQGEIEHWGMYRNNAEIHNMHEFGTIDYAGRTGTQHIRRFAASTFADLGLLIQMSPHTDLLLGVYAHYALLDMQDATPVDIGWKDDRFPNLDVQEYNGILATNCLSDGGRLHPWQAGVKIGLHWHSIAKPRTVTVIGNDTLLHTVERYDSVWTTRVDTLQRHMYTAVERVQQQIDRLNRVYFEFDSHELSPEAMQSLDKIAEQLKTIPNKVLIGGHASKEGTRAHNERLARNRALMVKYYLVDKGVPATRMIVKDYGSTVSNAINLSDDLALDRRAEIIVLEE